MLVSERVALRCGCEAGWRCEYHAQLASKGRPDAKSEAVVMLVYRRTFYDETGNVVTGTGELHSAPHDLGLGRASGGVSMTGGRPRIHRNETDRRRANAAAARAYRARKAGA